MRGLGEHDAALQDFSRAVELEPDDAESHLERGITRAGLGDYRSAVADFSRAIELEPTDTQSHFHRGICRAELGEYLGAIDDFEQAAELDPSHPTAIRFRDVILVLIKGHGSKTDAVGGDHVTGNRFGHHKAGTEDRQGRSPTAGSWTGRPARTAVAGPRGRAGIWWTTTATSVSGLYAPSIPGSVGGPDAKTGAAWSHEPPREQLAMKLPGIFDYEDPTTW